MGTNAFNITVIKMFKNFRTSQYLPNFQNLHTYFPYFQNFHIYFPKFQNFLVRFLNFRNFRTQFPNFQNLHIKLEFVDFSLIGPVSTQFTNYFEISLKNFCVRRKHRIKILKTICTRYCNYLVHMVLIFLICNTGPVKKFFETKSIKTLINLLL